MSNECTADAAIRWKNRRRMAWAALIAALLFPLIFIAVPSGEALATIAAPFYFFCGAVVGGYIGFAAWDDKNLQREAAQK